MQSVQQDKMDNKVEKKLSQEEIEVLMKKWEAENTKEISFFGFSKDLKNKVEKTLEELLLLKSEIEKRKNIILEKEPIAFGIIKLIFKFIEDESYGISDELIQKVSDLEEVSECEVPDFRRVIE